MNTGPPEYRRLFVGVCTQLACIWEATARKPGNVHPAAGFADLTYADFVRSAEAIAPVMNSASSRPVGKTVLEAIRATRRVVSGNTNLGMVLLLAPLAAVPLDVPLEEGIHAVLNRLDGQDAAAVYEAIRLAVPGGLGRVEQQDVAADPTVGLREAMALAANRDLIARHYTNGFHEVFAEGVPALTQGLVTIGSLEEAIITCHLNWMARHPDSLIARKCGVPVAEEAARRAGNVLNQGWPHSPAGRAAFRELDAWLRADGNRRNPGTSADLVTACLYVLLREGRIELPLLIPWSV